MSENFTMREALSILKPSDLLTNEERLKFVRAFHRKQHASGGTKGYRQNRVVAVLQKFRHQLFFWRNVPPVPEDKRVRPLK